jgi:hypothetical protein
LHNKIKKASGYFWGLQQFEVFCLDLSVERGSKE